jgi:hypothetical protein
MIKIYKLIDPTSNEVKYIGQTKDSLEKRLVNHLHDAFSNRERRFSQEKRLWIISLFKTFTMPKIELIEEVDDKIASEKEKYYIKTYGETLLNVVHNNNFDLSLHTSNRKSISIYQYDLDGNFIREWKSITEASSNLNIEDGNICYAANGKRKIAGNFQWSYIKHSKLKSYTREIHKKTVYEYGLDGNFIKEYSAVNLVDDIKPKLISKCCLGNLKSVYGRRFSFKKVENLGVYIRKTRQAKI